MLRHFLRIGCRRVVYDSRLIYKFSSFTPTEIGNADILSEQLSKADNVNCLKELCFNFHAVMNNRHLVTAFESLHNAVKGNYSEISSMKNDITFELLCNRAQKRIRFFETDDVITMLKCLGVMEVSSKSVLMQSLLQMIRHNMNELELNQIAFMDFLLSKQEFTPLGEALRIAMPLVLETRLPQQLNPNNLAEVVDCLVIAVKRKLSASTIDRLICTISSRHDQITPYQAFQAIHELCSVQPTENSEALIKTLSNILAADFQILADKKVILLAYALTRTPGRYPNLYNVILERALTNKWDLVKLEPVLLLFSLKGVVSNDILELCSSNIKNDITCLRDNSTVSIVNIISAFAISGYQPKECIWDAILECKEKFDKLWSQNPLLFTETLFKLILLKCYPLNYIQMLLSEHIASDLLQRAIKAEKKDELLLHLVHISEAVQAEVSSYTQPYIPKSILSEFVASQNSKYRVIGYPMKRFLEMGLGGEQYLATGAWTSTGQHIDHLLILRKGNFPVPFTSHPEMCQKAENIMPPQEGKKIAILLAKDGDYCQDESTVTGFMAYRLRILENQGFSPVLVSAKTWFELLDHEKTPYIMRVVHNAMKGDSSLESSLYPST